MHSKWGDRMSKAETLYNYIQYGGKKRIEEIVDQIMWELLPIIGPIQFPESISTNNTINKIYALLENGYYPYLAQALEKYGPCPIHRKTYYPVSKYYNKMIQLSLFNDNENEK